MMASRSRRDDAIVRRIDFSGGSTGRRRVCRGRRDVKKVRWGKGAKERRGGRLFPDTFVFR